MFESVHINRQRKVLSVSLGIALIGLMACTMSLGNAPPKLPPKPLPKRPVKPPVKRPPKPLPKRPTVQARKQPPRQSVVAHPSTKAKTAKPRNFSSYIPKTLRTRVNQWRDNRFKAKQRSISIIEPHVRSLKDNLSSLSGERQFLKADHAATTAKIESLSKQRKATKKSYNIFSSRFRQTRLVRKQLQSQINVERRQAARISREITMVDRNMAFIRKELKPSQKKLDGLYASVNRRNFYSNQIERREPSGGQLAGELPGFGVGTRRSIHGQYDEVGNEAPAPARPHYEEGPIGGGSGGTDHYETGPIGGGSGQYVEISLINPPDGPGPDAGNSIRSSASMRTSTRPAISTRSNPSPYDSVESGPL